MEYLKVERTKKGLPALWENGGAYSNTGHATIIGNSNGDKKNVLFTRHFGQLACGDHGLFIMNEGDLVCKCSQWRGDITINLYRLGKDCSDEGMEIVEQWTYSEGEWDKDLPDTINKEIVQRAIQKSYNYHCRSLYYGIEKPQKVVA